MRIFENPVYLAIIALFGAMIFVGGVNARWFGSAKLVLLRRWIRAACFSLAVFVCLRHFLDDRPVWVLGASSVLLFLLLESAFYWAGISLENTDEDIEMFPKFEPTESAWSTLERHAKLRGRILAAGFCESGKFKLPVDDELGVSVFATTFDSADGLSRMCVMFPFGGTSFAMASVKSRLADGRVMLTESRFIPNGLDYPENYDARNFPLDSNPLSVYARHLKRLAACGSSAVAVSEDPLADLNGTIDAELAANIKSGLINLPSAWDEDGVYTDEGKYRIWISTMKMSYIPFV
ncbi:hypothetical protein P3B99_006980 [Opitutia bacterium KCR 482]|nr:hypothetical protein [Opitutae bacterium KCR 482]